MIDQMLGPYRVVEKLDEGGMGEVYKARDTRLDRSVAIKVLPAHVSADPDRRARFEREAKTIAGLNHPHICTLHDVGEHDGSTFLVMEHLTGETLAERLQKGPLPLEQALKVATEIADALSAAHRQGVIHRDLKPGNVMLTKAGAKLLDFGLAKLKGHGEQPAAAHLGSAPTQSTPLTAEGMIVGTLQYMAPEQLEGKAADARTDLWALGAILYEMVTGKRAFEGTSAASLITAIMGAEPPALATLQPLTPPVLDRLVRQCLAKAPDDRWDSAHDVADELRWLRETSGVGSVPPALAAGPVGRRRERLGWVVAGVTAVVALTLGAVVLLLSRSSRPTPPTLGRFAVTAPAGGVVVTDAESTAVSLDGRLLAFTAVDSAGVPRLWIRPLDTLAAQPLAGTENAELPFWSPDGRFIAFFADRKLRKIPVGGGSADVICDAPAGRGGTWNRDGVIVFAPTIAGPLVRVSANGGEAVEVARPDPARGEAGLRFPSFLPDGRHFLYVSVPSRQEGFDVYVGQLGSSEPKRVMSAGAAPVYADPGYLLFVRGDRLVAQRFDTERLQPLDDPVPLGDVVPKTQSAGGPRFSVSATGVLVHAAATLPDAHLVWLDRGGRRLETIPLPPARYGQPFLSPDGRRAVVVKSGSPGTHDLWLVDLERANETRLTFDGLVGIPTGFGTSAAWSPDGSRVAYMYRRPGGYDVYQVLAAGAGRTEPLVESSVVFKFPTAWSPDGKYLVFAQNEATDFDLWLLPLQGNRTPVRYLRTPFNETDAAVSPDARWLAFASDETGTPEIYVRSFPQPRDNYRVSTSGGTAAQWSKDGKELLILTLGPAWTAFGPVFSVDVQTTPTFRAGSPRRLFTPRGDLMGLTATSDLKRFLAAVPVEGSTPASITVILNWQAGIEAR